MPETLQHWLHWLSGVRAGLLEARTTRDVSSALADGLVPKYADELKIIMGDAGESPWSAGPSEVEFSAHSLPERLWKDMPAPEIWLCARPDAAATDGGWVTVAADSTTEPPPGRRVALPISMGNASALVVLDRRAGRATWTAFELMMVNEAVRLAEFALRAVEQHCRTLEARAAADSASHRWAAYARLSRRLARSIVPDDVVSAILTALVPYLADWALLDVLTPEHRVERVGWRHALPSEEPLLAQLTHFPFGDEATERAIERLGADGWWLTQTDATDFTQPATEVERPLLAALSPRSIVVVPLVTGGQPLGALTLGTAASGQQYEAGDLALFRSLAHQAALALSNARLYRDAERARMEREELIAMVSHDLKNPLNILRFSLTILGQEGIPEKKKAPQFGVMGRSLAQMEELVNNLLDAARIDAGRFSVSPVPHNPGELMREAAKRAEPLAEKAEVRLEVEGTGDLPPILADGGRLMQVFANLLDNAISFTPANGRVCLRASLRGDAVCFEVEDSGPGLEPEVMEHVFDRFWQARHSGRAGAGLGLAIARGIVEAHGGTIGVRSAPGSGALFHFSISCAPSSDAGLVAPGAPEHLPSEKPPTGR